MQPPTKRVSCLPRSSIQLACNLEPTTVVMKREKRNAECALHVTSVTSVTRCCLRRTFLAGMFLPFNKEIRTAFVRQISWPARYACKVQRERARALSRILSRMACLIIMPRVARFAMPVVPQIQPPVDTLRGVRWLHRCAVRTCCPLCVFTATCYSLRCCPLQYFAVLSATPCSSYASVTLFVDL